MHQYLELHVQLQRAFDILHVLLELIKALKLECNDTIEMRITEAEERVIDAAEGVQESFTIMSEALSGDDEQPEVGPVPA